MKTSILNITRLSGLLTCLLLAACSKKESAPATTTGAPAEGSKPAPAAKADSATATTASGKKPTFAFVTNSASTFWTIAEAGVKKASAEFGVNAEIKIPASGAIDEQQRLIEELIARKIDGMAISPIDPKNMTGVLNEAAGHMPLITQDSDAPDSKRVAYIGTNNVAAGKAAGEELKKALPNGGKIMIFVGRIDAQNAIERRQGILEAIAGTQIQVIDTRLDMADQAKAKANAEDAIVAYPDLAGMVGLWSYNGPAIYTAVNEAGKSGKIKIVCFDEETATLQGIGLGDISATIVQKPFEFGYQSVRLLAELAKGDKSRIAAGNIIDTGVEIITKDNLEAFQAKLKELTGGK